MEFRKVSIVLPVYNGQEYLSQSIESCLNQTYKNIELIIVDDGSIDKTSEIIKSFNDIRIIYIKHEKNKGLPNALNTGFSKTSGDYLTWTSSDNYYSENAIEKMLDYLIIRKCFFVYCDYFVINKKNFVIKEIKLPDYLELDKRNMIGACFLYKKVVAEKIGNYDNETELAEDYDYWIRISKEFKISHYNIPLYFYREHEKSLYSSRYYEVKISDFLVRVKNRIINLNRATFLFIKLISDKSVELSPKIIRKLSGMIYYLTFSFIRLNDIFVIIFWFKYRKKILEIILNYRDMTISFSEAKIRLEKIINAK